MAGKKVKKIDTRDIVYEQLASAIMQDSRLNVIRKHKEGLEYKLNDETFIVRVVKKKTSLAKDDFQGEYFHDAKENAFGFR
jgi:hypothetical protein